jgi:hypothetical protein
MSTSEYKYSRGLLSVKTLQTRTASILITIQGRFASPHPDALDAEKCQRIIEAIESVIS